jgi:threonine dehydrogenase-like Zn-dependent dehydrogenase
MKTQAMVQFAARRFELMELDVPRLGPGEALLRVEACGLCGSDIEQYRGTLPYLTPAAFPMIPGHEPVGIIEDIDPEAARAWDVQAGDRVAIAPHLVCGACDLCRAGNTHLCKGVLPLPRSQYGFMPLGYRHGLWGGYSRHMVLHPASYVCKVAPHVPSSVVAMYQAIASGLRWAVDVPRTRASDAVLVLGCGQRGLASIVALRSIGVETIIVTGLERDAYKLEHARRLGACATIVADRENTVERVMALTGGRGVDVAIDLTPGVAQPFLDAIEAVRVGGTIVVAGIKDPKSPIALNANRLIYKEITVHGVFTQSLDCYRRAVELISDRIDDLLPLHTHDIPLVDVADGIALLAGETPGANAISVVLRP